MGKKIENITTETFRQLFNICKDIFTGGLGWGIAPHPTVQVQSWIDIERAGIAGSIRIDIFDNKPAAVIGIVFPFYPPTFFVYWIYAVPTSDGIEIKTKGTDISVTVNHDAWTKDNQATRESMKTFLEAVIEKHINYVGSTEYASSIAYDLWRKRTR